MPLTLCNALRLRELLAAEEECKALRFRVDLLEGALRVDPDFCIGGEAYENLQKERDKLVKVLVGLGPGCFCDVRYGNTLKHSGPCTAACAALKEAGVV